MQAQEWLEENYPDKEIEIIYINQQLEGVLDFHEYKSLEQIFISSSVDRSRFEIKKSFYRSWSNGVTNKCEIYETKIIPCLPAQTWLGQNYPKNGTCLRKEKKWYNDEFENHRDFGKTREEITNLGTSEIGLEGNLDLSGFQNLEVLYCNNNCLTNLKVNNCQ